MARKEQISDSITLFCGDCRDVLPELGKFDCAIVDPPYGETSLEWDKRVENWPALVRPHLKPSGSMWVFGSQRMFLETAAELSEWKFSHDVIWEKHNGTGLFNDRFRRVHELALHFYRTDSTWENVYKRPQFTYDARARTVRKKGRPAQWIGATGETTYVSEDGGPRLQRSVIYVRSEHGNAEHPTQKPIGILEPLVAYACPLEGVVLDPMMGSGSTGIAAKQSGLGFVGIEGNPKFFDIACRRITDEIARPRLPFAPRVPAVQEAMAL